MARILNIDNAVSKKELEIILQKAVQSANLNFLIGSGCSTPAINPLGNIEKDIQDKIDAGDTDEAEKILFNFIIPFLESTHLVMTSMNEDNKKTLENYESFLSLIFQMLFNRKNNLITKQATIFSTNYDLFIEKASEQLNGSLILNDGFNRSPVLGNKFKFSSSGFFNSIYNNGNLHNYQVQVPSVNLIKLHGSLSWSNEIDDIIFSVNHLGLLRSESQTLTTQSEISKLRSFNSKLSIILPKADKFKDTLMNQVYYDMFRIYANELDKKNTLLIAEGISFTDKHLYDITKRALRNPTLKLVLFTFKKDELTEFEEKFSTFKNVDIVYKEEGELDFATFNNIMRTILPKNIELDAVTSTEVALNE